MLGNYEQALKLFSALTWPFAGAAASLLVEMKAEHRHSGHVPVVTEAAFSICANTPNGSLSLILEERNKERNLFGFSTSIFNSTRREKSKTIIKHCNERFIQEQMFLLSFHLF